MSLHSIDADNLKRKQKFQRALTVLVSVSTAYLRTGFFALDVICRNNWQFIGIETGGHTLDCDTSTDPETLLIFRSSVLSVASPPLYHYTSPFWKLKRIIRLATQQILVAAQQYIIVIN